jgi:hypothetical protein
VLELWNISHSPLFARRRDSMHVAGLYVNRISAWISVTSGQYSECDHRR